MPVHVGDMTTEVSVFEGDLPLNATQIDRLVKVLKKRLADDERAEASVRAEMKLKHQSTAPFEIGE